MAQFPKAIWVKAVEMKCAECIYDPGQKGTWREQVASCTAPDCPLYPIRPLPTGEIHCESPVIPNLVKSRQDEWYGRTPGNGTVAHSITEEDRIRALKLLERSQEDVS